MKLLRLKITDPRGFRSLQAGFEYLFRSEWDLLEEDGFAPFVCAGRNGSGKSNLLEVLAAIFYHLECMYLVNLPDSFRYEEQANPNGFRREKAIPDGFEIEYLIPTPTDLEAEDEQVQIKIVKQSNQAPEWFLWNPIRENWEPLPAGQEVRRNLLPDYVLGYSSGENEILSLPFFKMRFVQFDEYWQALKQQLDYTGSPESRLVYLDSGFSQAILLCNLLFQGQEDLSLFCEDVGIQEIREFRIIIRRSVAVPLEVAEEFGERNPALTKDSETGHHTVNLMRFLEADEQFQEEEVDQTSLVRYENFDPIVTRLKRCATCWFLDQASDTLYLDYYVNEATRQAFRENFSFEVNRSPIELFQAFQVLLTLNLYAVSNSLKSDLYQSDSLYVSENVPTLAADDRIIRFKDFWLTKTGVSEPVLLKSFSDGEHQLLHTLGLCLLFKNTNSLFLLDEPETGPRAHLNRKLRF